MRRNSKQTKRYRRKGELLLDLTFSDEQNPSSSPSGRPFQFGDSVRIKRLPPYVAEKKQENYGGWNFSMERCLGCEGIVRGVTPRTVCVDVADTSFYWNPDLLELLHRLNLHFSHFRE